MLNDVEFREVQELAKVEKVKIVACDGKSKILQSFTFQYMYENISTIHFNLFDFSDMNASKSTANDDI